MLRCLISFFFVTVLGCSSSTPPSDQPKPENAQELPPANGAIPQCIAYENDPKTFGYCLYKFAGGFPSIQEVDRLCPMAGEWEKDERTGLFISVSNRVFTQLSLAREHPIHSR